MESARKFNDDVRASRDILLFGKITNNKNVIKKKVKPALRSKRDLQVNQILSMITAKTEFSKFYTYGAF